MSLATLLGLCRPSASPVSRIDRRRTSPANMFRVEALEGRTLFANFAPVDVTGLIASINAANQSPEADTITLKAGFTYTLTAVDNTTDGPNGLPVITAGETLTIVGNGATIERRAARGVPACRLIDVAAGASLTITGLTLQGGWSAGDGFNRTPARGGAILNQGALTITGSTLRNNTAHAADLILGRGDIGATIVGVNAEGGGVWSSGTLSMMGCQSQGNLAAGGTGNAGYYYKNSLSGDASEQSTFAGTTGGYASGGALFVAGGAADVAGSTFTANAAHGGNGGAGLTFIGTPPTYSPGDGSDGGTGGAASGGAICAAAGAVTVRGVTATANRAAGGAGGAKGLALAASVNGTGSGGGLYIVRRINAGLDRFSSKNITADTASTSGDDILGVVHRIF